MIGLTPRQSRALAFIKTYASAKGYAPTFDEIAGGLGLSGRSGVHRIVAGLEARGAIRRISGRARAIEIVPEVSAEHHLRALLSGFNANGFIWHDDPAVDAARKFIGGAA
jgi:repressor LexA